ncbi:MAG TPA: ATP-binding protein [Vicinamibacterales bacterium]|nr:ATP-binding protein [Vicinamibacterales bacterium]
MKRRATDALFAVLDRAQHEPADAKIKALLHELQVHGEEIATQNDQLRKAQAELEHVRDRYADLYDLAPIGYLTLDRKGVVTDINVVGAALLARPRDRSIGIPLSTAIHRDDRAEWRAFLTTSWRATAPRTMEWRTADATPRQLQVTCRPQGEGPAALMFTTMIDVTQARTLEADRARALQQVHALLQRIVGVQEEERRRLARNLHDHLGQQLTALRFAISSLKEDIRSRKASDDKLAQIEGIAAQIDRDVDALAWDLRPAALDKVGLNAALASLVSEWAAIHGIAAEFHSLSPDAMRLATDIESHLYRIVQEALNNVGKHARAHEVSVMLERRGTDVIVIVEDDGAGFDVGQANRAGQGMGLASMRERAALIDGEVQIESKRGQGTTLFVRVPARTVPLLAP